MASLRSMLLRWLDANEEEAELASSGSEGVILHATIRALGHRVWAFDLRCDAETEFPYVAEVRPQHDLPSRYFSGRSDSPATALLGAYLDALDAWEREP